MNIRHNRGRHARAGFSLAELMVVIVIIGLLATLVIPNVVARLFTGQVGKAKADIIAIEQGLNQYAIQNGGRFPDNLEALVTADENGNTYLDRDSVPKDPWGNEYVYEAPGPGRPKPVVKTYGADGVQGGEAKDRDFDNLMIKANEI